MPHFIPPPEMRGLLFRRQKRGLFLLGIEPSIRMTVLAVRGGAASNGRTTFVVIHPGGNSGVFSFVQTKKTARRAVLMCILGVRVCTL